MALSRGQDRLALLQAEAQRRCGMPGWDALARADLVPLRRAVRPGQLQHDPPPHRTPAPQPPAAGIAPPRFWTVSSAHTKQRRQHCVPLSAAAIELLKQLKQGAATPYVFPGA